MKILTFGASYSKMSINKKLAFYVANQFNDATIFFEDLTNYSLPLYTIDEENEIGIPKNAVLFFDRIKEADLVIISLAEHNGTYTAGFKNLFDWLSRIENNFFIDKKLFLLSTSPGPRGGLGAMEAALGRFPRHGAEILDHFTLPKFYENFKDELGVVEPTLNLQLHEKIAFIRKRIAAE